MTEKPSRLRRIVKPKVLVPVVLTAALLAFAVSISDIGRVMDDIRSIPFSAMAGTFGLALAYTAVKFAELNLLLRGLDIRPNWRQLFLAAAVGEMAVTVPSGIYVQNYVLRNIQGAGFARSAAATSAMLGMEALVVFLTLAAVPIPHWEWLQPAVIGMLIAAGAGALVLLRYPDIRRPARQFLQGNALGRGVLEMLEGLGALFVPRLIVLAFLLSIIYLYALVLGFLVIGWGVGLAGITFPQALTIYFFSLGIMLMLGGVLSQLGVIEVAGLGAAQAWGYSVTQGLAMLLGFRIVWVASIWLIAGSIVVLLRKQFHSSSGNERDKSPD